MNKIKITKTLGTFSSQATDKADGVRRLNRTPSRLNSGFAVRGIKPAVPQKVQ